MWLIHVVRSLRRLLLGCLSLRPKAVAGIKCLERAMIILRLLIIHPTSTTTTSNNLLVVIHKGSSSNKSIVLLIQRYIRSTLPYMLLLRVRTHEMRMWGVQLVWLWIFRCWVMNGVSSHSKYSLSCRTHNCVSVHMAWRFWLFKSWFGRCEGWACYHIFRSNTNSRCALLILTADI